MKSSAIERVSGQIMRERRVGRSLEGLELRDQRKVLMYVANRELHYIGNPEVVLEAIQHLGFRDEEVLVFVSLAAIYQPKIVPELVQKYCRNTALARHELGVAIGSILGAFPGEPLQSLHLAIDCLEYMKPHLQTGPGHNYETTKYMRIWSVLIEAREGMKEPSSLSVMGDLEDRLNRLMPDETARGAIVKAVVDERKRLRHRARESVR